MAQPLYGIFRDDEARLSLLETLKKLYLEVARGKGVLYTPELVRTRLCLLNILLARTIRAHSISFVMLMMGRLQKDPSLASKMREEECKLAPNSSRCLLM